MLLTLEFVACIEASICNVCSTNLGGRFGSRHVRVVGDSTSQLLVDHCGQPPRTLISCDSGLGKIMSSYSILVGECCFYAQTSSVDS
jgi:hypothetical protein